MPVEMRTAIFVLIGLTAFGSVFLLLPEPARLSFGSLSLIAAGAALAVVSIRSYRNGMSSRQWPRVHAQVLDAGFQCRPLFDDPSAGVLHWPWVRYRYQVSGQSYTGSRWRFATSAPRFDQENEARAFLAEQLPGETVTIRCKPDCPQVSVIIPGLDDYSRKAIHGRIGSGFLLAMLGLVGLGLSVF